jgi:hypothetical protein
LACIVVKGAIRIRTGRTSQRQQRHRRRKRF